MFHQFTQILITRCLLKGGVHHGPGLGGDGVLEQGDGGDLLGYLLASGLLAALHHWMRFHKSHTVLLVKLAIRTLNNLAPAQLLLVEFHFLPTCKKLMIEFKENQDLSLKMWIWGIDVMPMEKTTVLESSKTLESNWDNSPSPAGEKNIRESYSDKKVTPHQKGKVCIKTAAFKNFLFCLASI